LLFLKHYYQQLDFQRREMETYDCLLHALWQALPLDILCAEDVLLVWNWHAHLMGLYLKAFATAFQLQHVNLLSLLDDQASCC
jgi:hypothetical protein